MSLGGTAGPRIPLAFRPLDRGRIFYLERRADYTRTEETVNAKGLTSPVALAILESQLTRATLPSDN